MDENNFDQLEIDINKGIACKKCLIVFDYTDIFEETGNCIECHDREIDYE